MAGELRVWLQTIHCEVAYDMLTAAGFDSLNMLSGMDQEERELLQHAIQTLPQVKQRRIIRSVQELPGSGAAPEVKINTKEEPIIDERADHGMSELLSGYASDDDAALHIETSPGPEMSSPAPSRSRSRSRSPRMVEPPIPTFADLPPLPPKPARKRHRLLVPRGSTPHANHGWDIKRTLKAIDRCGIPGQWYQGGQNDRIIFTNDAQTYYIHQQSSSMWVQGQEETMINARLVASQPQAAVRAR